MANNWLQSAEAGKAIGDALTGGPRRRAEQEERQLRVNERMAKVQEGNLAENARVGKLRYNEQGTGLEQQRVGLEQRRVEVLEAGGGDPEHAWSMGMRGPVRVTTRATMRRVSKMIPAAAKLMGGTEELVENGTIKTRQQLYEHFKQAKATGEFAPIVGGIVDQISKLQEKGDAKSLGQIKQLEQVGSAIMEDGFIDSMFGKPKKQAKASDMGSMVEYIDKKGGIHYLPSKVEPPAGWQQRRMGWSMSTTPEGGATMSYGYGGVSKQIPSKQAEDLGSLSSVNTLLDKMESIVEKGQGNLTGPMELLNKIIDNWDIKSLGASKDRVRLRAMRSAAEKVLYNIMGKQLSDRELKVGKEMIMQMYQEEGPFLETLKQFRGYINGMMRSKADALRTAGYDVPDSVEIDIHNQGFKLAVDARGDDIMDDLLASNPDMTEKEAEAATEAQLEIEFGIKLKR